MLANVNGYLAQGYRAVKIKVGHERLEEDTERVQAVRELIGSDVAFEDCASNSNARIQAEGETRQ